MARAKRHHIPGQIWHITHRCHKGEFLLKFAKDRRRWLQWLFEAKKRYSFPILNYPIASNHIHLLVVGDSDRDVIPNSVKLIAGLTGQEYNQRTNRKGAFWGDRHHTTAVDYESVTTYHKKWVDEYFIRDEKWTRSIAVGSRDFVEKV